VELLKQDQYVPLTFDRQILMIFGGTSGVFDDMAVEDVRKFEAGLNQYCDTVNPPVLKAIMEKKALDDEMKQQMADLLKMYKEKYKSEQAVKA